MFHAISVIMKRMRKWQKHLTSQEARAIALIEAKIKKREEELRGLRPQRQRIQNRATARAGK